MYTKTNENAAGEERDCQKWKGVETRQKRTEIKRKEITWIEISLFSGEQKMGNIRRRRLVGNNSQVLCHFRSSRRGAIPQTKLPLDIQTD